MEFKVSASSFKYSLIETGGRSRAWIGPLAIVGILAHAGCSGGVGTPQVQARSGGTADQQAVPVVVAPVIEKPMPIDVRVIGSAAAYSTVSVHAQLTGVLRSVMFREGDDVSQGQVLFALDRRPLEAALHQAESNLAKDMAQAANSAAEAKRYQGLFQRGITAREQLDQILANAAALDATVDADRASVESAKVQLDYATIASPIAGRTGALMVHPGNLVQPADATPLVVINQVVPIFVSFGIPEAQLPALQLHLARNAVQVMAQPPNEPGEPSVGHITFVDNQVDQTTGTIRLKATFPNADRRLWPGQFVNVIVTLATDPHAIVVPSVAVQTGQQGEYVFVVKPDQTVDLRMVSVERTMGSETVIGKGLKPAETVVTDGQLRLIDGSRITIKGTSEAKAVS